MWALFVQRLDQTVRWLLPLLSAVLFILIGIVPWPLPYFGAVSPVLVLIAVYYWGIYRPDLFKPSSAFFIGLVYDAINDFPLGAAALIFVAIHQLALSQRRFFVGHAFFMLWTGFALVMLISTIAFWVILSLWFWRSMPVLTLTLQALLTIVVFPLPAWLLIRIQRGLLSQN